MTDDWRGTFTAIVTPFSTDGSLDVGALERFADFQVDGGVEGLVVCGTTGETPSLNREEQLQVLEIVKARVDGRAQIMAGAGANATEKAVSLSREMEERGAEAILSVVPYYNKPTQEGMFRHFARIADAVSIPVFIYNVPGRTSANMRPETVARLSEHGNIAGIKEASGDLVQVMEILQSTPEEFRVLSGEDNLAFPLVALGGDGVISVVSNEAPTLMSRMVREALDGSFEEARELHYRLLDLMNANFMVTNPIPVKTAVAMMGLMEESFRLPMVPMESEDRRRRLRACLEQLELVTGAGAEVG